MPDGITIQYEPLPKKRRSHAGNRGLQLANEAMIGFLDGDDVLLPEHIEALVQQLHEDNSVGGAYACAWEVPTEIISTQPLKYLEGIRKLVGGSFTLEALWNYNFILIQALLFCRELYVNFGGFAEALDCLEDWDLWLRYTTEKDFAYVSKPTSLLGFPSIRRSSGHAEKST